MSRVSSKIAMALTVILDGGAPLGINIIERLTQKAISNTNEKLDKVGNGN